MAMTSNFIKGTHKGIPYDDFQRNLLHLQFYEVLEFTNIAVFCPKASSECQTVNPT